MAIGVLAGASCMAPEPEGPAPPTLLSLYGSERFQVEIELPRTGVLRSRAQGELSGQSLRLAPRPFSPPSRSGSNPAPPSAPWLVDAQLSAALTGAGSQNLIGDFSAAFEMAEFSGQLGPTGISGNLEDAAGETAGSFRAWPVASPPLGSYVDLARRIESAAKGAWVEARRLELTPWRTFIEELDRGFQVAQDDVEAWLCFERALKELNARGIRLSRPAAGGEASPAGPESPAPRSLPGDWIWASPAALCSAEQIDSAVASWPLEARGAVLDLRGSGPRDLHLARLLAWLNLPGETLGSLASQGHFRPGGDEGGPIVFRDPKSLYALPPGGWPARLYLDPGRLPPTALGRERLELILLLDNSSGPGALALAAGLKRTGRARLVGRGPDNPGEVLRPVDLGDGFALTLPVARFLVPDGRPLGELGLVFDVPADSARETELSAVSLAL